MKTILLIDDDALIRKNTAALLELAQYNVLIADSGKQGVELALAEKPDLIICDIMMPVLDGFGVLHMLSKSETTASIPFIFLTAKKKERTDYRKGMDMGADDYVLKSRNQTELLNAIDSRMKKSCMNKKESAHPVLGLNDLFAEVKDFDDLQKLSEKREMRIYHKKELIYRAGSYPKNVYFLNKGNIKVFKTNEQGKDLITWLYKKGDFFGYLPMLEDQPYDDSAMAMKEAEVCVIPRDDFFALIHNSSHISQKFLQLVSDHLRDKEQQLIQLAYSSVRKRVAEALINLSLHFSGNEGAVRLQAFDIPREDLANIAGTTTESTIRVLSDFKQEGLIKIKGSHITILLYDQLQDLKN